MLKAVEDKLQEKGINVSFDDVDISVVKGADTIDLVNSALDNIITKSLHKIYEFSLAKNLTLRQATYAIAIERVYLNYKTNGLIF
jgi:hypothetical protein